MAESVKAKEANTHADNYLWWRKNEANRRFKNWGVTALAGTGVFLASPYIATVSAVLGGIAAVGGLGAWAIGSGGMLVNLAKRPFIRKK